MNLRPSRKKIPLPLNEESASLLRERIVNKDLPAFAATHVLTLAHFLLQDSDGLTPLYVAASNGHLDQIVFFLEATSGERLRLEHLLLTTPENNTVLHQAAAKDQLDVAFGVVKASGESLRRDHFLLKNSCDLTPLYWAVAHGRLEEIIDILEPTGERFTAAHFLEKHSTMFSVETPLEVATLYGHLPQVFTPSYWTGRVGEMKTLWDHVPDNDRGQIDYETLRNEAIALSVAAVPRWNPRDFKEVKRGDLGATPEMEPEKVK